MVLPPRQVARWPPARRSCVDLSLSVSDGVAHAYKITVHAYKRNSHLTMLSGPGRPIGLIAGSTGGGLILSASTTSFGTLSLRNTSSKLSGSKVSEDCDTFSSTSRMWTV